MNIFVFDRINSLFYYCCILVTFAIVTSWVHRYSLHKLSSSIDIKNYFHSDLDVQPAFSICVTDPKLNEKIQMLAPNHNESTYIKFLRGKVYYEELRKLDFGQLKFNWSEYFYHNPKVYLVGSDGRKLRNVLESNYQEN